MTPPDDTRTTEGGRAGADTPAPTALEIGQVVAGYRIEAECGSGGFGTVYRATKDGSTVALKVLHPYLTGIERIATRFLVEAEAIGRVHHPDVVHVREIRSFDEDRMFIAMDWVDGHTVKHQLASGPLSLGEARAILEPLCDALAAVHAAGVVHRDIKASNVMLTPTEDDLRVTLLDFGIAKLFEASSGQPIDFTSTGDTIGTPHAMAPEQFRGGPVDARTDIYALGTLFYEMLTGTPPFAADTAADIRQLHLDAPPPRASDRVPVPPAVDALIARCLAKDANARFPDAGALRAALATCDVAPESGGEVDAIAIYVSVIPTDDSDAALDRADAAIERAAAIATELGLEITTELPSGFVALAEAPTVLQLARELRHSLVDRVRELTDQTAATIRAVLHRAPACHDGTTWTGPLLDLRTWAAEPADGITLTKAVEHPAADGDEARRGDDAG